MTPAINLLKKLSIAHHIHEYEHQSQQSAFGLEAVEKLNLAPEQVFKTLVVQLYNGQLDKKYLAVAIIPVSTQLNMKLMAKAAGAKRAEMADKAQVERSTGYVLGGVSPVGQKKVLPSFIDSSAQTFASIFVSGGRRGLELEICPEQLSVVIQGKFFPLS